jgi:regulator of nucleoside diphosphate kinase
MATEPHFQLTTKDHAVLQAILERHRGPRGPYVQLLERKVRDSSIYFREDIPPGVVTLDTRLTYFVDGTRTGPHLIVQSTGADLAPFALSIHTIRGLALLGMAEQSTITLDLGEGVQEVLRVEDVVFQPSKCPDKHDVQGHRPRRQHRARGEHRQLPSAQQGADGPTSAG